MWIERTWSPGSPGSPGSLASLALLVAVAACGPATPSPDAPGTSSAAQATADQKVDPNTGPNTGPSTGPGGDPVSGPGEEPPASSPGDEDEEEVIDLEAIRIEVVGRDAEGEPTLDAYDARSLLDQGNDAIAEERHDDAIAAYEKLLDAFPDSRLAPAAIYNFGLALEGKGDYDGAIARYRVLATRTDAGRDSIDAHVRIAAVQAELERFAQSEETLVAVLARRDLTHGDRIEAMARLGYAYLEQDDLDGAERMLEDAIAYFRKLTTTLDTNYYVAMSFYYRAQVSHRRFRAMPLRLPEEQLKKDYIAKRERLEQTYDRYREALQIQNAYWATASGYQMSQIYKEFWDDTVLAPLPARLSSEARELHAVEIHRLARQFLEQAMNGHRTNVELAAAYKTTTVWSEASRVRAAEVAEVLARESSGELVIPERKPASLSSLPSEATEYVPGRIDL